MFTLMHYDTIASSPEQAQEHTNAARDIPADFHASTRSPSVIPLSGTAATLDPPLSPSLPDGGALLRLYRIMAKTQGIGGAKHGSK